MKIKNVIVIPIVALAIAGWYLYNNTGSRRIKHVIIISMDTTRADALSCYGNTNKTTPNIDALAAEGVLFENNIAPIPLTLPSHCSMLTGTTPLYHGVHDNMEYHLNQSHVTLAEILKEKGFSTAAFISAVILDSQFGLDQGFDIYNDDLGDEQTKTGIEERSAGNTTEPALEWIDDHHKENMFIFLHYYDPHMDYNPPEPYASMFGNASWGAQSTWDIYNGEIAYVDHCIGQVIDKLKSLKIYDSTLIIVTADHGEMFGEHGEQTHAYFVYKSNIKVPMIFKLPGRSRSARIKNTVGLVDIVPTISSLMDIKLSSPVQGKDISPYLLEDEPVDMQRHIYSEALLPTVYKCSPLLALISDHYKYIQTTRPELYDIIADPLENNNLIAQDPNLIAQTPESKRGRMLKGLLGQVIEQTVMEGSDSKQKLDEETFAKLESLGYVAGGIKEDFSFDQSLTDPKDRIAYHIMNSRHGVLLREQKYDELRELAEEMIAIGPLLPFGHFYLGCVANDNGEPDVAVKSFKKAIQCDPEFYKPYIDLAVILFHQKQYDQSLTYVQEGLRLKPGNPKAVNTLALHAWLKATSTDDKLYDPPAALELILQAMEIATDTKMNTGPGVLRTLAAAQAANGNFTEAIESARTAVQLAMSTGMLKATKNIIKEADLYKNNTSLRK